MSQRVLKIFVFNEINKWINCTVHKHHKYSEIKIGAVPVKIFKSNVIRYVIKKRKNFNVRPTNYKTQGNSEQSFNRIGSCNMKLIASSTGTDL